MKVEVIEEATSPEPEKAVALAARNDYYAGDIMADGFEEVMEGVTYDENDARAVDVGGLEYDETAARKRSLIRQLLRREHYGPFEHAHIQFHVKGMSRVTMAQLTRHRHMSFDIQSMRYVDFEDADVAVPKSLTDPGHFSRDEGQVEMSERTRKRMLAVFERQVEQSVTAYNNMVEAGVPKEDARYILPLGAKVNVVFSGNLRTMLHVLNMRSRANAQWEIRDLCDKLGEHIDEWAPRTAEYFEENGPFKLGM